MGSCALWELCDGQRLKLTTFRRGKGKDLYNIISDKEKLKQVTQLDFNRKFTQRRICYTNDKRKWVNKQMMDSEEKRASRNKTKLLRLGAVPFDKNSQDVRLTKGTPAIARKNDRDLDLCNSESFTVTKINVKEELLEMTEEGGDRVLHIPFDDFQKLFYVAWCITLHKSQGCTFDHEYTIHEMDHPRFDARAKYVALSRSTTLEYIKVW